MNTPLSQECNKTSHNSLVSRFRLNAVSYGYAQLVTLLAQFLLVPFFLKYWGTELYADWLVLTSIPLMLTLLDLGVAQASASRATILAGSNNTPAVYRSLQTSLAFTLFLAAVILLAAAITKEQLNWSKILGLSKITPDQASTILFLMSAYLCINLLGGPVDGWFKAIDKTACGAFLLANRRMIDIIVSVIVLTVDGTAVQLATTLLIAQTVTFCGLLIIATKLSPWPMIGLKSASWSEFCEIWRPAIAYAGFPLAQVITLQGGLQVLNQVATPSIVVGFTMARTMMRLIIQLGVVSNNALKPEISRLAGRGEIERAKNFALRTSFLILILSISIFVLAIIAGPWIIEWWGGGKAQTTRLELASIGIHAILNVAWFVPAALLIALNQHISTAAIYGISSIIALLLWISILDLIPPILGASILLAIPELVVLSLLISRISSYTLKEFSSDRRAE